MKNLWIVELYYQGKIREIQSFNDAEKARAFFANAYRFSGWTANMKSRLA